MTLFTLVRFLVLLGVTAGTALLPSASDGSGMGLHSGLVPHAGPAIHARQLPHRRTAAPSQVCNSANGWQVCLTASSTTNLVGDGVTLTAFLSADVSGDGDTISILGDDGTALVSCTSGTTCSTIVAVPVPAVKFYAASLQADDNSVIVQTLPPLQIAWSIPPTATVVPPTATPVPSTATPTSTPTSTATPTPAPSPTVTPIPLTYQLLSARAEKDTTNPDPSRPALQTATVGDSLLLSVYIRYRSLPDNVAIIIHWTLTQANSIVLQRSDTDARNHGDTGLAWYYTTFTPRHAGSYHLVARVTVNGTSQDLTGSFSVTRPKPTGAGGLMSFAFEDLQVVNAQYRSEERFYPGEQTYTVARFRITNAQGAASIHIKQAYQYWSASRSRWIAGRSPYEGDIESGDGDHIVRNGFRIPSPLDPDYTSIRITITLTVGKQTARRAAVFHIVRPA